MARWVGKAGMVVVVCGGEAAAGAAATVGAGRQAGEEMACACAAAETWSSQGGRARKNWKVEGMEPARHPT